MSKKQKNAGDASTDSTIKKRKKKVWRVKLGGFLTVTIYDLVTWVGMGLCIGLVLIYGFQKNWRGFFWSLIVLGVLILVMLAIRAKQHFWDSEEIKECPEIYVKGALMKPLVAGQPETVVVGLKNRGNGTARNIRMGRGNHMFAPASFTGPLECKPSPSDTRPDLFAGEESSAISPSQNPLSQQRITDLEEGRLLFFHFAEGEYGDNDGAVYPLDYCFMYTSHAPTIMRICPERYWPKERKDRKFPANDKQTT